MAQANVLQRRGRAGRLREGESYHLFTEQVFEEVIIKISIFTSITNRPLNQDGHI